MHSRASPHWPVLGSPAGGIGTGAGLCDFYRAGKRRRAQWGSGHSQRSFGGVRIARSVSIMDSVMALLERSASPPDTAAGRAEHVYSVAEGATSPPGIEEVASSLSSRATKVRASNCRCRQSRCLPFRAVKAPTVYQLLYLAGGCELTALATSYPTLV